jgi:hypothetical protein
MFIVKAKLAFPEKRDAERCVLDLQHTVFDRCATTHYKVVEEDDEHSDRGIDD